MQIFMFRQSGSLVSSKQAGTRNFHNIMFFMNTVAPSMFSWGRNDVLSNEKNTALFIIPAFRFDDGRTRDYVLC